MLYNVRACSRQKLVIIVNLNFYSGEKMKQIFKNALYLFVSNVAIRFFSALATILVARYLGARDYGILGVAISLSAIAGYFTDLGLIHTLIREGTKSKANIELLMSSFLKVRVILSVFSFVIFIIIIEFLYDNSYFKLVLYLVVIPSIAGGALQGLGIGYFQLIEEMKYIAYIRGLTGLLTSMALLLGMLLKWSLIFLAGIYGCSNLFTGILSLIMVMRRINIFSGWNKKILDGLWQFMIVGFISILLPQLGPIVLEKTSNLHEVGVYTAAYRIPSVLYQIPGIVAAAFYPVLFKHGNANDLKEHTKLNVLQVKVMIVIAILVTLPFILQSKWWVRLLFGNGWNDAIIPLIVLSFIVILQSINYPLADSLTTLGLQKYRTLILLISLIIGTTLFFVLGEKEGAIGGAISAVLIEVITLIGLLYFNPKGLYIIRKSVTGNIMIVSIILLINFLLTRIILNPIINIISILLIYLFMLLLVDKDIRSFVLMFSNKFKN